MTVAHYQREGKKYFDRELYGRGESMCNSACGPMVNAIDESNWRLREIRDIMIQANDYEKVKIIDELMAKVEEASKKERLARAYDQLEGIRKQLEIAELMNK